MNTKSKSLFNPANCSHQFLQLLANAYDQMDIMSGIIDLDGRIVFVNQAALVNVDKKLEDLTDTFFRHSPYRNQSNRSINATDEITAKAKNGEPQLLEDVFLNSAGQEIPLIFSIFPVYSKTGKIIALVTEGKIIPDIKNVQVTLEEEKWETQQWINSMSTLLAKCDPQGRIITCNQPFLSLLQMNSAKLSHQYICDITELEIFNNCQSQLKNIILSGKSGKKGIVEIELTIGNGQNKNYLFSVNPINDSLGNIAFLAVELVDITKQVELRESVIRKEKDHSKRLKKEITEVKKTLAKTEQFNKSIIDSAPTGIVYLDENYRVMLVNPPLERILRTTGISKEQIIGKPLCELNIFQANHLWKKISDSSDQFQLFGRKKMVLYYNDKEVCYFEVLSGPLRTPDGSTQGTILTFNDITERVRLEAELLNSRIQAEKMSSLGLLVSGIAHEINNPLTSILGCAEYLLEETVVSSDAQKAIQIIVEESKRADRIVKNLLMMALPPASTSESQLLDLNELIENTISLRIQEMNNKELHVSLNLTRDIRPILANRIQLQQVILNILQNSIYAIEESDNGDRISISTKEENNWIIMRLEDNGPGIPIENRSKIFDPFFSTKPPGKGTGLGLSISYGVINRHGGFINLDPDMSSGTCFIVRLPAVGSLSDKCKATESKNSAWKPSRVLIVDNEITLRRTLAKYLESLDCEVNTTSNGHDALKIMETKQFDLILAAVSMPMLTGLELYHRLRKKWPESSACFALMTGLSDIEILETAREPEIPLLRKPFSRNDVNRLFSEIGHPPAERVVLK